MTITATRRINGATVRVLRDALGIRGCDLAARAHISGPFLSRIEQGARHPSPGSWWNSPLHLAFR